MKFNPTKTVGLNFIKTCDLILEMVDRQFDPQARGRRKYAGEQSERAKGVEHSETIWSLGEPSDNVYFFIENR